jgi:hypothetical protein
MEGARQRGLIDEVRQREKDELGIFRSVRQRLDANLYRRACRHPAVDAVH